MAGGRQEGEDVMFVGVAPGEEDLLVLVGRVICFLYKSFDIPTYKDIIKKNCICRKTIIKKRRKTVTEAKRFHFVFPNKLKLQIFRKLN